LGSWGHLSLAKQEELCEALLGIPISQGTLSTMRGRSSNAVAAAVTALRDWLRQQPVVGMDETGWRVNGQKAYLWTVTTPLATLLHVAPSRGSKVITELLGEHFAGTVVCDFFKSYDKYCQGKTQRCLAHLLRDVDACGLSKEVQDQRFAVRVGRYLREIFQQRSGRPRDWESATPVRVRLRQYLTSELPTTLPLLAGRLRKRMLKYWGELWGWESNPLIPPDNNGSERALRLGVTQRKVCGGSRSEWGKIATARLLTVVQTCRQQKRSAVEFLREALLAQAHTKFMSPSLLPSRA
jgi:transposase